MKYKISHMLEYGVVRAISAFLVALPHRVALGLVWGPVRLAFALNGKLQARTLRRMRQALGEEIPDRELKRMAWLAFRNLAFTAVEGIRFPGIRKSWVDRHMELESMDEVHAELAQGHGFIVAVPHMGNWELAGIAMHSQGVELMTLARKQKNPLMDAWINRLRMSTGVEAIDTRSRAVGDVARKLREEKKVLALLPDVRSKAGGIPVTFLDTSIDVPGGAAHYARETGLPVFTAEVIRTGWARHSWHKTGRIMPDPALGEAEDRRRIMQFVMDRLGESVRAHPENYFWFNKRWVLGAEDGK